MKRQWPMLSALPELYEHEHRSCITDCISLLEGSTLAKGTSVYLSNAEEASLLAKALADCQNIAEAHMLGGGRVARVIVGKFKLRLLDAELPDSLEHPDLELMDPTSFALGRAGPGGRNGELRISLGLKADGAGLVISAQHSRTAALKRIGGDFVTPTKLLASVSSASTAIRLGSTTTFLLVDSIPRMVSDGAWSSSQTSSDGMVLGSNAGHIDDVLCVLCVRDAASL